MTNKRNTGVLSVSGALLLVGLLAPSFTAAQDTQDARQTPRTSAPSPQEPARTIAGHGPGFVGPAGFWGPGDEGRRSLSGRRTPGQVLSHFTQDRLRLTEDQRRQLVELQKEVDTRLNKILTTDQKQKLQGPRERGPVALGQQGRSGPQG